jgi:serine/threonine-protein kinase
MGEELERWRSLPMTRLDLHSCRRYARDLGWRLPDELEREKAARGVDGRPYPWGSHHDPALSNVAASRALPAACPVQDFPLDESVYGLRGLAGNVRDICNNRWTELGTAGDGERLVLSEAPEDVDYISVRGGAWGGTGALGRAAVRFGDLPSTRHALRGLRLCRSLSEGPPPVR